MTTSLSAKNQTTYFTINSLYALVSELENIPSYFSRITANIGEALAGVQFQTSELNRIRNILLHDMEKSRSKSIENEHAQSQISEDLEQSAKEIVGVGEEVAKLDGQIAHEKVERNNVSQEREICSSQKNQLQSKLIEISHEIETEISELSGLKKLKKDGKRDKVIQKKKVESLLTTLLSANTEIERLKDLASSLKANLTTKQSKGELLANDSREKESAILQQKLMNLQTAIEECQSNLRFCLQSQTQMKKRLSDRPSSRIQDTLKAQLQQVMADDVRCKTENQGLRRRQADIDRTFLERQAEFSQEMETLNHSKTLTMEHRNTLATRMIDLQRTLSQDDDEIRQLTVAVNELTISVEFTKNRQAAAKKLKQHIKKTKAEIKSITQDSQAVQVKCARTDKAKTGKSRVLKLD
jgi:chromosome segregation ATPase